MIRIYAAIAVLVVIGTGTAVLAHQGATGIVKERMDAMKDIADAMKAIGTMMKAETPLDHGVVAASARSIAAHAQEMPTLFPEGSTDHPSEALPAIWENWHDFSVIASELSRRAEALAEQAGSGDGLEALRPGFAAIGKTCQSCHQDYRAKQP